MNGIRYNFRTGKQYGLALKRKTQNEDGEVPEKSENVGKIVGKWSEYFQTLKTMSKNNSNLILIKQSIFSQFLDKSKKVVKNVGKTVDVR